MLRSRIGAPYSYRLTIQRPAPRRKPIIALGLVEPGAQLLVGTRHVIQLLSRAAMARRRMCCTAMRCAPAALSHGPPSQISGTS
jgi:hypothetical protein